MDAMFDWAIKNAPWFFPLLVFVGLISMSTGVRWLVRIGFLLVAVGSAATAAFFLVMPDKEIDRLMVLWREYGVRGTIPPFLLGLLAFALQSSRVGVAFTVFAGSGMVVYGLLWWPNVGLWWIASGALILLIISIASFFYEKE